MTRTLITLTALAVAALLAPPATQAAEIGNLFKGRGVEASSKASAQAIDGLVHVFRGLQARELKNVDGGREQLAAAAKALGEAQSLMKSVPLDDQADLRVLPALQGDFGFLVFEASELKLEPPRTMRDLYAMFVAQGAVLLVAVNGVLDADGSQPVFLKLEPALNRFLYLGELVTRLGRVS